MPSSSVDDRPSPSPQPPPLLIQIQRLSRKGENRIKHLSSPTNQKMKMAAPSRFSSSVPFMVTRLPSPPLQRDLPLSPTPTSADLQFPIKRMPAGTRLKFRCCRRVKAATRQNSEVVVTPNSVPVRVAYELLQAGHRYLDVRTEEEFSRGHVEGAVNIPYMLKFGNGLAKNPTFLQEVLSCYKKHDEILVGCQNGKRSLMAATDLLCAGFTGITGIAGGFSTWTQIGLPMEQ